MSNNTITNQTNVRDVCAPSNPSFASRRPNYYPHRLVLRSSTGSTLRLADGLLVAACSQPGSEESHELWHGLNTDHTGFVDVVMTVCSAHQ
jgi:hypothetical protein